MNTVRKRCPACGSVLPGLKRPPRSAAPLTSEQIRKLRHGLGVTQPVLAQLVGVNRVTLARWEIGRVDPRPIHLDRLRQLAKKHGVSLD